MHRDRPYQSGRSNRGSTAPLVGQGKGLGARSIWTRRDQRIARQIIGVLTSYPIARRPCSRRPLDRLRLCASLRSGGKFAALRVVGVWKPSKLTIGDLMDRFDPITDLREVRALLRAARRIR